MARAYYNELVKLSFNLQNPVESDLFVQMLRLPDVISTPKEELSDELWQQVYQSVCEACDLCDNFREQEGRVLAADFDKRVRLIDSMIDEITPFETQRIVNQREKFIKGLEELKQKGQYDPNRLEQEMIFYIEKLDPGKFPKVPGRRQRTRGFPAAPRERPRESFFNGSRGPSPLP